MVLQNNANLKNARILLVDDQEEIRALLCDALRDIGVSSIEEACDGKHAMSVIASSNITLIVCDWNMPHMTGIELLKHVRTIKPNLPFLMMTSRSDKDSLIAAKEAGVHALLRKPFTPKQLEEKICNLTQEVMA